MTFDSALSFVSFLAAVSSIIFAYMAFKRSREEDTKSDGKNEGVMFSDIGYIKACVDRVEKNLTMVDERYRNIAERLAKVEESVANVIKRVDEIYKSEIP
jgi:hypothetical protein